MWKVIIVIFMVCPAISSGRVLDVPEITQEQSEWCWAAVSSCVLNYYGNPLSQCTIADFARENAVWHDFGSVSCCEKPDGKCNYWNYNWGYPGSIQEVLEAWGVENHGSRGSLTLEEVQSELDEGRPFIIRWERGTGGHFVVGHGINETTLYYMDPWFGEGYKIAEYAWVVSSTRQSWQGTNVITTNPPAPGPVTLLAPPDSSIDQPSTSVFTWESTPASESYRFQCATTASFNEPLKDTVITRDTTFSLSGLSSSTVFFWRVRATNTVGNGEWSAIRRFTTESSTSVVMSTRNPSENMSSSLTNSALSVTYTVKFPSPVRMSIHTLRGKLLTSVYSDFRAPGQYTQRVAGLNISSGNYVLLVDIGGFRSTTLLVYNHGR